MKTKEHHNTDLNFEIIFEKLDEAKQEQFIQTNMTTKDLKDISDSINLLHEIQQSIDTSSYTFFTRT